MWGASDAPKPEINNKITPILDALELTLFHRAPANKIELKPQKRKNIETSHL
jgi:hypothetical protein